MSSRREFLKQAAAAGAAIAVGDKLGAAVPSTAPARVIGANEKVRLGVAGVHNRGRALAMNFAKMTSDAEVVCICDCDTDMIPAAQQAVFKASGKNPDAEKDFRRMVERDDIDAVVVAMPDHWHAAAAIMSMQRGKHV